MALQNPASSNQAYSGTQSGTYILSLDPVIDAIRLDDTDLLSTIGMVSDDGKPVTQTKHEWDEDALNPVTVKATATLGVSTGTVLIVSSSQAARITAGTLLRDQLSGKTEVLQVTARSGVSATVTRAYGGTQAAHGATATYDIISNARPQGMDVPKDESMVRTRSFNYTQIFSKGVIITGTAEAIQHNGLNSESAYQADARMRELMRELDRTLIMGVRASANVGATTYGTMGGLYDFINVTGGNINSTAEYISPSVINQMCSDIFDDGGTPSHLVVGAVQRRKVSAFDKEYRRSTLDSRRAGFYVEEFVTDLGVNLQIVLDRWVPSDTAFVIDASRVKVKPMTGRGFFLEKLARTGDADKWQIVGEYTAEVKNGSKAHAVHTNLKP